MATAKEKLARKNMTRAAKNRAFKGRNVVRCVYCGKGLSRQSATGDHRNPISKGGENKTRNIVIACSPCNSRKGAMSHGTFIALIKADGTFQHKRKGVPS